MILPSNSLPVASRLARRKATMDLIREAHASGRRLLTFIELGVAPRNFAAAVRAYGLKTRRRSVVVVELPEALPPPVKYGRKPDTAEQLLRRKLLRAEKAGLLPAATKAP